MEMDLLNIDPVQEERLHKLKRLVQAPNSYFMDVKCKQCDEIATIFSHSQTAVSCESCSQLLCTTSGGKVKLVIGSAYRRKGDWASLVALACPSDSWNIAGKLLLKSSTGLQQLSAQLVMRKVSLAIQVITWLDTQSCPSKLRGKESLKYASRRTPHTGVTDQAVFSPNLPSFAASKTRLHQGLEKPTTNFRVRSATTAHDACAERNRCLLFIRAQQFFPKIDEKPRIFLHRSVWYRERPRFLGYQNTTVRNFSALFTRLSMFSVFFIITSRYGDA